MKRPVLKNKNIDISSTRQIRLVAPIRKPKSYFGETGFFFLNESSDIGTKKWVQSQKSMLWQYNLHYFDFINSEDLDKSPDTVASLINSWIDEVFINRGCGWDPYPSSLRIVNWIKWILKNDINDPKILLNLFTQVRNLSGHLEYHIFGNHLFANAKALIFAGTFFGGKEGNKWLKKGSKILRTELDEQFLEDGGHFELSPMYHSILLEDMLDLLNLATFSNQENLTEMIKPRIDAAMYWLETMLHPDGDLALFNDTTFGVSPTFSSLCRYADRMGLNYVNKESFSRSMSESGYTRLENQDAVLFFDHGQIGPKYQPGHAHADTLSFELSLFNHRFITNLGISTYERSLLRSLQRSTKNHSTVVIDDLNSSDVWASFRVSQRAITQKTNFQVRPANLTVSSEHNGYGNFFNKMTHRRTLILSEKELIVEDEILGMGSHCIDIYFHIHPDIEVHRKSKLLYKLRSPTLSNEIFIETSNISSELIENSFCLTFGKTQTNLTIKSTIKCRLPKKITTKIFWV